MNNKVYPDGDNYKGENVDVAEDKVTYVKERATVDRVNNVEGQVNNSECCSCTYQPLWILPIVSLVWNLLSIFVTFGIAVGLGHANVTDVPYISHAAVESPETYIFSQFLNIAAVLLLFIGIIRFMHVKETLLQSKATKRWRVINVLSFIIGVFAALGFSMLGNFPTGKMTNLHIFGGLLGFAGGPIYCVMQTVLTWKMTHEHFSRKYVFLLQFVNSICLVLALIVFLVSMLLHNNKSNRNDQNVSTNIETDSKSTDEFKTSSIAEWFTIVLLSIYMLTFIPHFRLVELQPLKIREESRT